MGEGTEARYVVVERDVDLDKVGDEVLDLLQLLQVCIGKMSRASAVHGQSHTVFAQNVVAVRRHHSCHQSAERRDSISLPNAKHRRVNVRRASLQCTVGIRNSAARIVMLANRQPNPLFSSRELTKWVSMSQLTTPRKVRTRS